MRITWILKQVIKIWGWKYIKNYIINNSTSIQKVGESSTSEFCLFELNGLDVEYDTLMDQEFTKNCCKYVS